MTLGNEKIDQDGSTYQDNIISKDCGQSGDDRSGIAKAQDVVCS